MKKIFIVLLIAGCTNPTDKKNEDMRNKLTQFNYTMDSLKTKFTEDSIARDLKYRLEIEKIKRKK